MEMPILSDTKDKKNELVNKVNNIEQNFTLDNLSESLVLSAERSRCIYDLYEKTNVLKSKSENLIKALDKEKSINQLQAEFVSLVSHEFKTPLAIIKTSMDVLKRVGFNNEEVFKDQVHKVDKAILRMTKLIESTLNLSRLESGKLDFKPVEFCIEDVLLEVIERHQDLDPKASFELSIDAGKKQFNGDKDLIDQVFTNLISNAIKYSKEDPKIKISCQIVDQHFEISVADSGIGMSQSDLKKLFGKFFRSSNTVGIAGTGIGLYLVKQFVELHHGEIKVESEEGVGTKFVIYLPLT